MGWPAKSVYGSKKPGREAGLFASLPITQQKIQAA
jgi:hypothetical protein